ncbi:MAG: calcium/sodium antiporter [Gammaproteobacteria bacterium]
MLINTLAVLIGLALLTYGADRFVIGASSVGAKLGMSPLIIGLTIVAFATSVPEMLVAGVAAWGGKTGLAIGNAVGSNITNIALVLGATAFVSPLLVHSGTIKREFPMMFAALFLAYALLWDGLLSRLDGSILLVSMFLMIMVTVFLGKKSSVFDPVKIDFEEELENDLTTNAAVFWLILGSVLLFAGSQALVKGASNIAQFWGVSDLIIGLTIVAIGTSLPELAASLMSAIKGEQDMALGNIIGSNMFNMLGVLSVPGLIHPAKVDGEVLTRDFPIMLFLSILMFFMSYGFRKAGKITKLHGAILLVAFAIYQFVLFRSG